MRPILLFVLVVAPALFTPSAARATWVPNGNPICTATGDQTLARCAPDGSGGAFVAWLDSRRGGPNIDLYATRILADGTIAPGWPVDGLALGIGIAGPVPGCIGLACEAKHSVVHDDAGGLMAFWYDPSIFGVRMQHVDGSGVRAPGFPAEGMNLGIITAGLTGPYVQATSDHAGGAYVLWVINSGPDHLRLTRVTGTGAFATGWNASGVLQAQSDGINMNHGFDGAWLATDPNGDALVAAIWPVPVGPMGPYVASRYQRTLASGAVGFGKSLNPGESVAAPLSIASDGAGGGYVAFSTSAAPTRRMQHYLANGTASWPDPTEAPVTDWALSDGNAGLYLFGRPPGPLALHRRARDASIPAPWTASGLVLSSLGPYSGHRVVSAGALLYATWSGGQMGDLRASAIAPDGALVSGWAPGGTIICNAAGNPILSDLVVLPPYQALAAWEDRRSGNSDIYVTLLEPGVSVDVPREGPTGPSMLAFAAPPSPNPARDHVGFTFTLAQTGAATLEILDIAGRVHGRVAAESRTGTQSIVYRAGSLPAGVYWARLRQGTQIVGRRFAVVH